ncbi:calcium-activated chloride channel regulator 4-like isoform X1 [Ruditapes philippinarum]|uniref:calcium-activated chloride channel regulator 4-like isoform X1 n=1 Tax=Ruditapes philippinarum TaxID=129788 RepID=UPI00295A5EF1|nr:calcium-activated chloride channel regulator 4-like isoform X1 [Ruditapes philippinarum]
MSKFVRMVVFIVGICMLALFKPAFGLSRPSTIVLKNNGFTNVVVAIHESVPEDKTLIDKLKDEMTKASKILYVATKQRAFLKEIKILLPSTWSNDGSYQTPTSENLAFADVIITDPIRGKRSIPQTRSYDGCGKQGVHVLLTKEFLTTPRADPYLNNPAKFFVHAFAQFRWGVFQEYAEEGENVFYMSPSVGQPEAIRCTIMIRGLVQKNDAQHTICYSHLLADRQHVVASIDNKTGLYHADCLWRPYPNHQRTKASIMDHQFIQELVTFCGDDPKDYATFHNSEAPSKHNRLCGHKSTWGIITETDDFRGGINAPTTFSDDQIKPTFIVMRATSRKRRAAVLINPSLLKEGPLSNKIDQTLKHLKHEASKTDLELSVLKEEMTSIQGIFDEGNGHNLYKSNTLNKQGRFEQNFDSVNKNKTLDEINDGDLVIVTDTLTENMKQILTDKSKSGLKVSVVSGDPNEMTNDHHEHFSLHHTGGAIGHTLLDRLRNVVLVDNVKTVLIGQEETELRGNEPVSSSVEIDKTLGMQTSFIFHFEEELPNIRITSPNGTIYGPDSNVYSVDEASKAIQFYFPHIQVGTWTYTLSQSMMTSQKVRVTVISENIAEHEDPLVLRQSVKFADDTNTSVILHVDATQGASPLIGFNVTAKVETPDGTVDYLTLLDNGAGADIAKNDGIYSRIYIAPKLSGPYHVTFIVSSGGSGSVFRKEETASVVNDELNPVRKSVRKIPLDGTIQRQISGGTIFLRSSKDDDLIFDVIAPSRIIDLRAVTYVPYRKTMVLEWTAPGDDHDHGKRK